jgi:outer membrane protein OmpA-like peptidoglycan-associated protein
MRIALAALIVVAGMLPALAQKSYEIQQPRGSWQQPGPIQQALFDFDKSNLRPDAEETLAAAGPEIAKLGGKPTRIEGHTDAIGSDAYNMKLSEARAAAVRDWLVGRGLVPVSTPIKGYGKSNPIAPNKTSDGRDDPEGRQKNRRVEVVFDTCT